MFYVIFDNDVYNVNDVKESFLELVNDGFVNLKLKQINALEDLNQIENESEVSSCVKNLELSGSGWSNIRVPSMTSDFYKDKTKAGSSCVEQSFKDLSILNIQKNDNLSSIWCIIARLHPVRVTACATKSYGTFLLQY